MSLDFLTTGDGSVLAISPLAAGTAAAGASFEARDGWEVPVRFADPGVEALACRERVGWADFSHLRKLEVQVPPARAEQLEAVRGDDGLWLPLTPERALLLDGPATLATDAHVLDVSSQLGALRIAGPLSRELFARFCALDLRPQVTPPGAFRPGSVARTPGYVLCEAPDRYLWLFGAAYGAYVWEVVSDAGAHLGGRPVGVDALVGLGEPSHA
jgi:glycine cleavage system aminomethyltransferase T